MLRKKYPVYITYQTAWVDEEGLIQFREDIYGHDKMQVKQLQPAKPAAIDSRSGTQKPSCSLSET